MAGLEEELVLDIGRALSSVDEVEDRLTRAADSASEALSEAFQRALDDGSAMADLVGERVAESLQEAVDEFQQQLRSLRPAEVEVEVDDDAVQDTQAEVRQLDSLSPEVEVEVDTSSIDDARSEVGSIDDVLIGATVDVDDDELRDALSLIDDVDGSTPGVVVTADTSELDRAQAIIDELDAQADVAIAADTSDLDRAEQKVDELGSDSPKVTVTADDGALDRTEAKVDEIDGSSPKVTVDVDDSALDDVAPNAKDAGDSAAASFVEGFDPSGGVEGAISGALAAGGAGAAVAGGATALAFAGGFLTALDRELQQDTLAARLGVDTNGAEADRLGNVVGRQFVDGFGESTADVAEAVDAVYSTFEETQGSEEALDRLSEKALAFSEVMQQDVGESVANVQVLVSSGLADSADEGFDLLTASLQRVPAAVRDEIGEAINEYSTFFASLGFSGEEALGLIVAAADDGRIAIDKTGDAIKEFQIRATDIGDINAQSALSQLGFDAVDASNRLLAGGATARQATQDIIGALNAVPDPAKQAELAIALFGTPLEDLNKEEIPEFINRLADSENALQDVEGAADALSEAYENNASALTRLRRRAEAEFGDYAEAILDPIADALDDDASLGERAAGLGRFLGGALVDAYTLTIAGPLGLLVDDPISFLNPFDDAEGGEAAAGGVALGEAVAGANEELRRAQDEAAQTRADFLGPLFGGTADELDGIDEAATRAAEQLRVARDAAQQFATEGTVDPNALTAVRAIAESPAFATLDANTQAAITGLIDFADAEADAAREAGELISSVGEVVQSVQDLEDALSDAISRFEELQGSQARYNAANRDIDSGIRGIDDQVRELGASLDDQGARFDTARINANNYGDYLKLLSDDQQRAIREAKVPDGFSDSGEPQERSLNDAEKADAVRRAIEGSGEALARANDLAKDNADSLLDYFDTITGKIADEGRAAIERGDDLGVVNQRVAEQVRAFRDAAIAAGVSAEAVDAYLATVDLSAETGFSLPQLDASGVLDAIAKLDILRGVIASFPPEVQTRINALEGNPEGQIAAIQGALDELPIEKQVAVQTALSAPDTAAAQFAIDSFVNTPRAITTLIDLGLSADSATTALADLAAFNANAANETKIPVTIEAAVAISAINDQLASDIAAATVNLEPGTAEYDAAVAEATAERDKRIKLFADTGQLDPKIAEAIRTENKTVDVDFNVPDWARSFFGIDGARQVRPQIDVDVNVERPEGADGGDRTPAGRRPRRPRGGDGGGGGGGGSFSAGGAIIEAEVYAAGGARIDPRVRRRLEQQQRQQSPDEQPDPGLYGAGRYVTFAEADTAGEYFISRKPTERARNQELVRTAAQDLGVSLAAPAVTVVAPQAAVPSATSDPALVAALDQLAAAQRSQRPARATVIEQINVTEATDAERTAATISAEFTAQQFLQGDI